MKIEELNKLETSSRFRYFDWEKAKNFYYVSKFGSFTKAANFLRMSPELYDVVEKDFKGFTAWIITSSPEAINSIGLRPSRRIHLFNGSLECRYLKFELYDGSKKASKNPDTMTRR